MFLFAHFLKFSFYKAIHIFIYGIMHSQFVIGVLSHRLMIESSERKQEQKNVNHKAEEQRLPLSNWIVLLEFSNLKGRLGGEMKTFIYLYISKWFKDD